jgi:pyrroloquinoline quinone biosynthesis protein D
MSVPPPLSPQDRFEIDPLFRFQWEESQQAFVLLYPEGVVKLNETGGEILKRVAEGKTVAQTVAELGERYNGAEVEPGVRRFLEVSHGKGWIRAKA